MLINVLGAAIMLYLQLGLFGRSIHALEQESLCLLILSQLLVAPSNALLVCSIHKAGFLRHHHSNQDILQAVPIDEDLGNQV